MRIFIASDHNGVELKRQIIENISNVEIIESSVLNNPEDDYPDFVFDIANRFDPSKDFGIFICGNGIGMSIAANKVKGIMCARVQNEAEVVVARGHNCVNAIAFGKDTTVELAIQYIKALINTPFSNEERHVRRVNKIKKYEKGLNNEI